MCGEASNRSTCANGTAYVGSEKSNIREEKKRETTHQCRGQCALYSWQYREKPANGCDGFNFFAGNKSCVLFEDVSGLRRDRVSGTISGSSQCDCLEPIRTSAKKEIEAYRYAYCVGLANITMPRVHTIGGHAFEGCTSLKTARIP